MKLDMKIAALLILLLLISTGCGKKSQVENPGKNSQDKKETTGSQNTAAEITFIELGSDKCIPCRQMQPVMRSIEEKYGAKIKVIFHDVWKDRSQAQKFGIQLIPTQVFLDKDGKEFYRHEGFFAEDEIVKLFETRGLKPVN